MLIRAVIILLTLTGLTYSQWEAGAAYSFKNSIPEDGFSIVVGRNLPFQWPLVGFMVNSGGRFFSENSDLTAGNNPVVIQSSQSDLNLGLTATFYYRYIQPYAGIGIGISSFTFEQRQSSAEDLMYSRVKKNPFFAEGFAGIRLAVVRNFYPYFELHLVRYFTDFSGFEISRDVPSFQKQWCAGLKISFDTI
jgi:hypothetical protein